MLRPNFEMSGQDKPGVFAGIFCDYFGTLVGVGGTINTELVSYLNIQHAAGKNIVIFSTVPDDAAAILPRLGLHPDIAKVVKKLDYYHRLLETVIDDNPTVSLKAVTLFDPKSAVFLSIMRDCLRNAPPAQPVPGLS
ncbi:MAG: hypothetical protein JWO78_1098 [Micavibrio sp.]|nr:hypothetical protein [Micavibrio sp.]